MFSRDLIFFKYVQFTVIWIPVGGHSRHRNYTSKEHGVVGLLLTSLQYIIGHMRTGI